jgi:hypothetical protein
MIYKESQYLNDFSYKIIRNFEFVESRKKKFLSKTIIFHPLCCTCDSNARSCGITHPLLTPPLPMHLELISTDDKVIIEFLE